MLLFVVLHAPVLGAWWTRDDPCLLRSMSQNGVLPHLVVPEVWQGFSTNVFMPLQILSLGFDRQLFGLSAPAFWVHQLLAFALLLIVAHRLFCRWVEPRTSGFALWLFVASAPTFGVVRHLMNRHYLEGLLLALLSLACYSSLPSASPRSRRFLAGAGAIAYFLACGAKEVYVPLPLVLLALPDPTGSPGDIASTLGSRVRRLVPWAVSLVLYLGWRLLLLGPGFLSSYGTRPPRFELAGLVTATRRLLPAPDAVLAGGALALVLALAVVLRRHPRARPLIVATPVAVVLPWIGIFPHLEARHLFAPALAIALLAAVAVHDLWPDRERRVLAQLVLGLGTLGLLVLSPLPASWQRSVEHYRAEGRWILEANDPRDLTTSLPDGAFLECAADLRSDPGEAPGYCGDPCWCADRPDGDSGPWLRYDGRGGLAPTTSPSSCDQRPGLRVELRRDPDSSLVSWELGPWTDGEYAVLLVADRPSPAVSFPIVVPPRGSIRWPGNHDFVFRYRSPEGWVSYRSVDGPTPDDPSR